MTAFSLESIMNLRVPMKIILLTLLLTSLSITSSSFAATVNTFAARLNAGYDSATPNYPNGYELNGLATIDQNGSMSVSVSGNHEVLITSANEAAYFDFFSQIEIDLSGSKEPNRLSSIVMSRFEFTRVILEGSEFNEDGVTPYDIFNLATTSIDLNLDDGGEQKIYFDVAQSLTSSSQSWPYVLTLSEVPIPAASWMFISSLASLRLMTKKVG